MGGVGTNGGDDVASGGDDEANGDVDVAREGEGEVNEGEDEGEGGASGDDAARLLVLLGLAFVPWTILGDGSLVFPWGLAVVDSLHVTTVWDYLFVYTAGLPRRLLAWPLGSFFYSLAVANAAVGVLLGERFEDRRLTGGLLALAGANNLVFAIGMANRSRMTVLPLGVVALWAAAWWFHWPDVRRMV